MVEESTDRLSFLEKEIIAHLFVARPTMAAYLGLHEYDGLLPDLSAESTERWRATAKGFLRQLGEVPDSDLPVPRRLDRSLLRLLLEGNLFDLEETRELDRNPMSYLFQPDLTNYISRDYAPIADRVAAIVRILTSVPSLLETAKHRLEPVLPRPFVTLSIQIAGGLPSHFEEGESFAATGSASLRDEVQKAREGADGAVRAFAEWLRTQRLPQATDDFALGRERFQRLLWVREGLTLPIDEVLRRGREDLKRNRDRFAEIARREGVSVDQLVARLNDKHPSPEELLPLARRLTDEIREFVRTQGIVTIPEPEVVHVRETPAWARDLWTAAMSSPGPFEKPVDGIYWVTAVDPAWTPAQAEEWMRTLNHAMLKNTTVHEVWPGHYLQSLHFRKTSQTLARKVWFSYSFIEGWAHYCEQAALEAGFDGRSTSAEVTQLHDALLRDCRLIVSIGMHTQAMSVADAARLLRTEAHLEEVHAQREAIRGTYNPEYFCYTLGKLAILDARSKYLATKFHGSLKAFHDTLLGFGTPPIGFLDSLLAGP
jgi:transcriptional regulator with XRE-family HTH domain